MPRQEEKPAFFGAALSSPRQKEKLAFFGNDSFLWGPIDLAPAGGRAGLLRQRLVLAAAWPSGNASFLFGLRLVEDGSPAETSFSS